MGKKEQQKSNENLPTRLRAWEITMTMLMVCTVACLFVVVITAMIITREDSRQNARIRSIEHADETITQLYDDVRQGMRFIGWRLDDLCFVVYGNETDVVLKIQQDQWRADQSSLKVDSEDEETGH